MRASNKLKLTIASNNKLIYSLMGIMFVCDIILLKYYLSNSKLFSFIIYTIPQYFALFYLFKLKKPLIDFKKSVETIVCVKDLKEDTLSAVLIDFIYTVLLFKAIFRKTYFGLFTLILIPLAVLYEFIYKPFYSNHSLFQLNKKD